MARPKRTSGEGPNVFISWSKDRSKGPAAAFASWLPVVVQAAKPWISIEGIGQGSSWFADILRALKECTVGVVFVTRENMLDPWIHLEAGAILNAVSDNKRVCPVVLDMDVTELDGPLSNLQSTSTSKAAMRKLVLDISRAIGSVDAITIERAFEGQWLTLEPQLKPSAGKQEKLRTDRQLLEEILRRVRALETGPDRTDYLVKLLDEAFTPSPSLTPPTLSPPSWLVAPPSADETKLRGALHAYNEQVAQDERDSKHADADPSWGVEPDPDTDSD